MTFTVNAVTRCANDNNFGHFEVTATVDGQQYTIRVDRDQAPFNLNNEDKKVKAAVARMVSAVKEANATTFAQARTALEGKTFQV